MIEDNKSPLPYWVQLMEEHGCLKKTDDEDEASKI